MRKIPVKYGNPFSGMPPAMSLGDAGVAFGRSGWKEGSAMIGFDKYAAWTLLELHDEPLGPSWARETEQMTRTR